MYHCVPHSPHLNPLVPGLSPHLSCFLKKLSGVRMLTTCYLAKNDHRWVTFVPYLIPILLVAHSGRNIMEHPLLEGTSHFRRERPPRGTWEGRGHVPASFRPRVPPSLSFCGPPSSCCRDQGLREGWWSSHTDSDQSFLWSANDPGKCSPPFNIS